MSIDAVTLADIRSVDWSLKLGVIGQVVQGVADVDQCIAIILTTPFGSDPLRPAFGADIWRYIDFPLNVALPAIVREVTSGLSTWEPRIQVLNVNAVPVFDDSQSAAHLNVTVTWQLKLPGTPSSTRTTVVTVSGSSVA